MKVVVLIIIVFLIGCQSSAENENINKVQNGDIYVINRGEHVYVRFFSSDLEEIDKTKVPGAWDLRAVGNSKVYVSIPGDANFSGDSIKVINKGKIENTIKLSYDLPLDIRYNKYNKRAYITHKYKITYAKENCISIIDTITDTEVDTFMYDDIVLDIDFSADNKMYISSQNSESAIPRIDVVNLDNHVIEDSIELKEPLDSIAYCELNQKIYGVSTWERDSILYSINFKEGLIISTQMNSRDPSQIVLDNSGESPLLYISNIYRDETNEGDIITVYDPIENKVINEIKNIHGNADFIVKDYLYAVANYEGKIYKYDLINDELNSLNIEFPTKIEKIIH